MSAPKLEKRGKNKGYEPLCRKTIQTIKDADALAIWTLLQSMPDSWLVRKKWLKNELGIGDIRYSKSVKRLKNLGLWRVERIRMEDGCFHGSKIIIFSELPQAEEKEEPVHRDVDNLNTRFSEKPVSHSLYENNHDKKEIINKPAELKNHETFSFMAKFGFVYPQSLNKLAEEERVLKIFISEGINESAVARKIIAEWSAMAVRGFQSGDPLRALVWACRNTLAASREGEESLPPWG